MSDVVGMSYRCDYTGAAFRPAEERRAGRETSHDGDWEGCTARGGPAARPLEDRSPRVTIGWLQVLVLAIVQGVTEFLPISSSAHLILVPRFTDWPDQGLAFDLAVHLGTLVAVVAYFRGELAGMAADCVRAVRRGRRVGDSRLGWAVLWGTVPVGLAGLLFEDAIETSLRAPAVIGVTTILFGVFLWLADRRPGARSEHELTWRDVVVVGCAQALALVPGTSRSGVTITAGLLAGLSRDGAARFSFLLAVPVTALAVGLKAWQLVTGPATVRWAPFVVGAALAALTAFLCIHYFLKWLTRFGLIPYVVYRFALGAVIIAVFVL